MEILEFGDTNKRKNYTNCVVKCFEGKSHCENALLQPELMIKELDKVLK